MTRPSLNCTDCVDRLADFVDRELTTEDLAQVEAHLNRCVACAREFRFEGEVVECLKTKLRRVKAPPGLLERIRTALDA